MSERGERPEAMQIRIIWPSLKWWIAGLIVFGIIAVVAFTFLPWIVFGLFIYYVARPINRRIRDRIKRENLSAMLPLLFIVVPVVIFLGVFLSIAVGQFAAFVTSDTAARLLEQLPVTGGTVPTDPDRLMDTATTTLSDPLTQSVLTEAQAIVGATASSAFMMFLLLLLAFFLLVNDRQFSRWSMKQLLGNDALSIDYLWGIDAGLNSIYFGYMLTVFVIMILTAIVYNAFNFFAPGNLLIPVTILLAVITGIFTLVPLVGRSIVYIAIAAFLALGANTTFENCITVTKPGGVISNVGYHGNGESVTIPRVEWGVGMAEKDIVTSLCPGGRLRLQRLLQLLERGRVDPTRMTTHEFMFDDIDEGFHRMESKEGEIIKPLIDFT